MKEIKLVSLEFPNRDDGTNITYSVGANGVTKIVAAERNGELARIIYYEIWKGDILFAEMYQYGLVIFKDPE